MIAPSEPKPWSRLVVEAGLSRAWQRAIDPAIVSIVEDSRHARPGSCFVARCGLVQDGHAYIPQAVAAGASAIVCTRDVDAVDGVAVLKVPDTSGVAGRLAMALTGWADIQRNGRLRVVGITGTNGKSTTCYLLRAILKRADHPTALLGTVQYDLLSRTIQAERTTPTCSELISYLAEATGAGATHAVMEVSSHALDQGRCENIDFSVGIFSNLTRDHLDYHGTMDAYLKAKKKLFDSLDAKATAVVNAHDPAAVAIVADCRAPVLRYGICGDASPTGAEDRDSLHVSARILAMTANGTRFELSIRRPGDASADRTGVPVDLALVGRHNVLNALAAGAAASALGVGIEAIAVGLQDMACVPGRLERVVTGAENRNVLIDYAHTDDALDNVLSALRPLVAGRLILVFGCGGKRDSQKRPMMAAVAARYADAIVVTSDNPRTEDPQAIIDAILAGFPAEAMARVHVEPDRREAIAQAIGMAGPEDAVLLAGKGHETYQEIGDRKIPFDDAAVAREVLEARLVG